MSLAFAGSTPASAQPSDAPDGFMQIAAHPDDDLYFMNPELLQGIRAGSPSTTVYLTAGEIQDPLPVRQRAVMAAYAAMARKSGSAWSGSSIPLSQARAEVYTMDARPDIRLVFLNLPDGRCLPQLWENSYCVTKNPQSAESGVDDTFTYHRNDLVTAINQLMREYRPAALRTLDAVPDSRYQADHGDHIASAKFANAAVSRYSATESARLFVTAYRGYGTAEAPDNLAFDDLSDKRAAAKAYEDIATHAAGSQRWRDPQYERWSRGSNWVGRNQDGTLQAFAVVGEKVLTWRQRVDGSWGGAQELPSPGGPLAPGLSVAGNYDGRLQLLGRRLGDDRIMTIHQTSVNGDFAASWYDFGNPNDTLNTANRSQVGTPILVRNADGLLQIFVKNGGGGVSTVYQADPTNGRWDLGWKDIGGIGVQDGLSAVVNGTGHVELFASTIVGNREGRLATWSQTDSKGTFTHNPYLVANNVASAPSAVVAADAGIRVFYRTADSGTVSVVTRPNVAGPWNPSTASLGGTGGTRKPGVASGPNGRMLLYTRDDAAGISLNWQGAAATGSQGWQRTSGSVIDSPAVATGRNGRLALFRIGTDGKLYVAEQSPGADDAPFSAWGLLG